MACQAGGRDPCPCTPLHTRFSLDGGRSQELSRFYQVRTRGTVEGSQGGHRVPLAAGGCGEMTPPVLPAHGEARCPKSMHGQEAGMPPQQPNFIPGSSSVRVLTKLKQALAGGGLIPGIARVCAWGSAPCVFNRQPGLPLPGAAWGAAPPLQQPPKCLGVCFYLQLTQQHREFYRDKSGMLYVLPYFVLPSKEKERYPHPLDLPPLSAKTRWHLLRVSLVNLRTYQTFPSGKRVTSQERETRDSFFEYRA
uniref:Ciliary microtubule inner protein 2C n=1 Tax=Aquila chrysaetos chrysaetos TaxID=223781 RepID=A0A663EA72_AQUCH